MQNYAKLFFLKCKSNDFTLSAQNHSVALHFRIHYLFFFWWQIWSCHCLCIFSSLDAITLPSLAFFQLFSYSNFSSASVPLPQNVYSPSLHPVQSLSCVWLFATPRTAAHLASLSITNSQSLLKLMSIASVMPFNHLILCCPPLLLPSIFPSTRVFSNESVLHIRWPKNWSFSFSISPSNEYSGLISFSMDWFYLLEAQGTLVSLL